MGDGTGAMERINLIWLTSGKKAVVGVKLQSSVITKSTYCVTYVCFVLCVRFFFSAAPVQCIV